MTMKWMFVFGVKDNSESIMKTKFSLSPVHESLFLLMLMRMRPAVTQPLLFSRVSGEVQEMSSSSIIFSHVKARIDNNKIKIVTITSHYCKV